MDIVAPISKAIAIVKKLKDVSDNVKNADFKNLLADLHLELAEIKTQLADVTDENRALKARVLELESTEGEKCPKCLQRGWKLESSRPDSVFGGVGGLRKLYKCSLCSYSENKLITS